MLNINDKIKTIEHGYMQMIKITNYQCHVHGELAPSMNGLPYQHEDLRVIYRTNRKAMLNGAHLESQFC